MTGDYTPGFRTVLGQKDLRLGRNLATGLGVPLQTLGISSELFTAAVAKGRGDCSSPAIITVLAPPSRRGRRHEQPAAASRP